METKQRTRPSYFNKGIFLLLLFTVMGGAAASQTNDIVPPSPNVATLKRFLDYPVDHSTGLANVSIPLYDIKLKDFNFPVTISFHASGRRTNIDYSPLGVGWSLNSLGFLSREVRKRPDEDYWPIKKTAAEINSLTAEERFYELLNADSEVPNGHLPGHFGEGTKDTEHDIYTYSANGISGKFVMDENTPFPLTYGHKVNMSLGSPGCSVVDEKGTQYNFGYEQDAVEWGPVQANGISRPSSWLLSRIITPSGEQIDFNYEIRSTTSTNDKIEGSGRFGQEMLFGSADNSFGSDACSSVWEVAHYFSGLQGTHLIPTFDGYNYLIAYLKEIVFTSGKITFTYDQSTLRLTSFQVTDNNSQVVQSGNFSYIQTPGTAIYIPNNNDHSLSAVQFLDGNAQPVEKYTFDYYNDALPYTNYLYPATDWWGYCTNPSTSIGDTPPVDPIDNPDVAGQWAVSDRTPSFSLKRSGMLKKINYPTGGNTEFIYEPNIYRDASNQSPEGPGLRIQKVILDDGTGTNKVTKLYKYGSNENGMGTLARLPDAADFVIQKQYFVYSTVNAMCQDLGGASANYYGTYRVRTFYPRPIPDVREAYSLPVYYDFVTEYTMSAAGDKNGKAEFSYSIPSYGLYSEFFRKKEWTGSRLNSKIVSRYRAAQNDYQPIETTTYNYTEFKSISIPELKTFRNVYVRADDGYIDRSIEHGMALSGGFYTYFDNTVESAVYKLTNTVHTTIDYQGNLVTVSTNFFYDNQQHMLPTRVVTTSSSGKSLESKTSYPPDINTGDYTQMTNRNMLNYPVERTTLVDSQVTGSLLTTYKPMGTSYGPDKSFSAKTNSPLSSFTWFNGTAKDTHYGALPEIGFDSYDNKGNILQMTNKSGVVTSYIWSYNQTLPVVHGQNISQADLATKVATAATNAGLNTTTWILNLQTEKTKWQNFNTLLRSYCGPDVLITTYSYKPLIGMTSMADSNGITTYYEYDSFGRLMHVKDNNSNIIKKYEYHYKTQ